MTIAQKIADIIERQSFGNFIMAVIVVNAIVLGLETSEAVT